MNLNEEYLNVNRLSWDARVESHLRSDFYDVEGFLKGRCSLNEIELELLPDLKNKTVLHLQCHFGQDSISMARRGAKVTGIDFSETAVEAARNLNQQCNADVSFICADIYSLHERLQQRFDIVFSSYGTIGWLPDIGRWAATVAHFLKPGGIFVFAEFHPQVWMFDNRLENIVYRYFRSEPIVETEKGSYADPDTGTVHTSISWNHGLAEVLQSLLDAGLQLSSVKEYDYSPYPCFSDMLEASPGKYRIRKFGDKIPLVYSLKAKKK